MGSGGAAAEEDRRRVAQYTAWLAAENARRVSQQRPGAAGGSGGAVGSGRVRPTADEGSQVSSPAQAEGAVEGSVSPPGLDEKEVRRQRRTQSVYMHGTVGTGKTMLLDLFCEQARSAELRVQRRHFYEFVLELHVRIHATQQERPIEVVANTLADEVDVLCFDEFQITDIQDAAILPRFFEVLFLRGVAIVMTSNTPPQLLYAGGLNRHVHLPPFVNLMAENCTVLGLGGPRGSEPVDYRRRAEETEAREEGVGAGVGRYVVARGGEEVAELEAAWSSLCGDSSVAPRSLAVSMGRSFLVEQAAGRACRVTFQQVCDSERGEADYLALAQHFDAVLLDGVPKYTSLEDVDTLRRFVKLLDVLYDRRVRLVLSAAVPLDELFAGIRSDIKSGGGTDDLAWRAAQYSSDGKAGLAPSAVGTLLEAVRATERAESRLREMRTRRYWQQCAEE